MFMVIFELQAVVISGGRMKKRIGENLEIII